MSWEEMWTKTIKCPCGKGTISKKTYEDDWNRFRENVNLDCEECAKKYSIEEEHFYKPGGDSWTIYYLTPVDYPPYQGIEFDKIFPKQKEHSEGSFAEMLIRSYRLEELNIALKDMEHEGAFARLGEVGKSVCKYHRRNFGTAKAKVVLPFVIQAIDQYSNYADNKEERDRVRDQERLAREQYKQEKRKHQIRIDF